MKKYTLQEIKIMAIKANLTMTEIATKLGYSRQHIYEAIKDPNKYSSVYLKILDTCNGR